jgi:hypothetical protein
MCGQGLLKSQGRINTYVLVSAHIPVMCVIRHSVKTVVLQDINAYIVGGIHISVICVIRHLFSKRGLVKYQCDHHL